MKISLAMDNPKFFKDGKELTSDAAKDYLAQSGIFETTRARFLRGSNLIIAPWFRYHLERLFASARVLGLTLPDELRIEQDFILALQAFPLVEAEDALLRLVLSPLGHILSIKPWRARFDLQNGIRAVSADLERNQPEHKSTSTLTSITALNIAESRGANEALLVDSLRVLREGAWSNFFWINSVGEIITPRTGILPGITRRVILEQFPCSERDCTYEEILSQAKAAFITHATHGVVPLSTIDHQRFSDPIAYSRISEIQSRYESLILPRSGATVERSHLILDYSPKSLTSATATPSRSIS